MAEHPDVETDAERFVSLNSIDLGALVLDLPREEPLGVSLLGSLAPMQQIKSTESSFVQRPWPLTSCANIVDTLMLIVLL